MADNNGANRAILAIVDALRDGWNQHDSCAFAASFAEDADFTNVFGIVAKGRLEVDTSHAAIFRTIFKNSTWTKADTRVRFLKPDIAAVDVRWEVTGSLDPYGNEVPIRYGLMSLIVTLEDGRWSIATFHNQDVPPPDRAQFYRGLWKQ